MKRILKILVIVFILGTINNNLPNPPENFENWNSDKLSEESNRNWNKQAIVVVVLS